MGRGSLAHLHQQLLARFDSVTKRESPQLISNECLKKLDGCYLRFKDWGDGVGVGDGALDVVERSGSSFKKSLVKSFDGIYIRLRVVGNLLKEGKELSGERDEEARAIVLRISADVDALEEQVPALKAFLENPDGLHADGDAAARHRQVSSSTANTRDTSTTWTTNTTADDEAYDSLPAPLRASAPPLTPKTPRTQTFQAFIGSDRTDTTTPTTATNTTSPGTTAPDWDDSGQWEDRDYVIRALSASQSQTSFAAASDDEDGPDAVFAPRKMLDFSSSSKSGDAGSSDSPAAAAAAAVVADSSPRHAANTTWIEDNSSTFKEGGSEESPKGAAEAAAAAAEKSKTAPRAKAVDGSPRSGGGELKAWEKDHDQFRKYIGARLGMLERHNRSLERRLEDLQGRRLDGDEARGVIEEFVKRKGEEERWEKSIREAAIEEYKEHVRLEAERERERRNVLMHQARLIEDRAQQEMSEIYQHTGVQIREAEQRHQDEVYQIQQRLTSELLVIERRIHEQIESSMWSASPNRAESAKKGKGPQVSFEARETGPRDQPEPMREMREKTNSLQVPSFRTSEGSSATGNPSAVSYLAPETPQSASFPTDQQNIHPTETQSSTGYRPMVAVAPWDSRGNSGNTLETGKGSVKRPSRFRRLATTLRLRAVDQGDINVVKVSQRGKGSSSQRKISKGSFLSRRRRLSPLQQHQSLRVHEGGPVISVPYTTAPGTRIPPVRPPRPSADQQAAPSVLISHPTPIATSPLPASPPTQKPPIHPALREHLTPPRHPPFSFQLNFPHTHDTWTRALPPPPPPPHQQRKTTKVHKNQISPDTLTYYGLPWEWDRADRDAVVILKDMEPWETNILFEHSRRKRLSAARAPHNSAVDDDDDDETTDAPPPPPRRRSNSRHLEDVGREIGERVGEKELASPFSSGRVGRAGGEKEGAGVRG